MKRADIVSVRKLLSGSARFRPVPSRRGFVWEPPQIAQLIVDLEVNARQSDDEGEDEFDAERFYLGVISASRAPHGAWILHDGLQRLAVVSLFLAFARDRIDEAGESQRLDRMLVCRSIGRPSEPRLRLTPEDHAWYAHFILPQGATTRLPPGTPLGSPKPLLLAARFMEQAFRNYSQDDLFQLTDFITRSAAVVRNVAQPEPRAWTPPVQEPRPEPAHQYRPAPDLEHPRPNPPRWEGEPAAARSGAVGAI